MFTHLKICGITRLQDALQAADLGVSFLGFNFFKESKRYISPEKAAGIINRLPPTTHTVGILVKPTLEICQKIVNRTGVDFLQIYDPLDFDDFGLLPVPAIQALRIKDAKNVNFREANARYVLVDAFDEQEYGGTGRQWNWQKLSSEIPREKLILAGGIKPDNILEALNAVNPAVIDVASGAEKIPGKKDLRKMKALQKAVLIFNLLKMNR